MRNSQSENKLLKFTGLLGTASFVPFLAIISACIVLRSFIFSSLWLDETISHWVIRDSLPDVFFRAGAFQGQSPFYYSWLWAARHIFGDSEPGIRILSVFCTIITAMVLYRIARKFFEKETSVFTVICLLSIDEVLVSAGSARPYAMALMFSSISFLALMDWQASSKFRSCLLYIVSTAFAVYSHYLFIAILPVHCLYALVLRKDRSAHFFYDFIITLTLIIVLLIPGVMQCLILFARKDQIGFALSPSIAVLFKSLMPLYIILYFALATVFCKIVLPSFFINISDSQHRIFLTLFFWTVSGPLMLFAYAKASGTPIFVSRYFLWTAPGLCLLIAWFVERIRPLPARAVFIAVFAVLVLVREAGRRWVIEDWAAAPRVIGEYSQSGAKTILLYSGLAEARNPDWLNDSAKSTYLKAPLLYYSIPGTVIPIPNDFSDPGTNEFFLNRVSPMLKRDTGIYLVCFNHTVHRKNADKPVESCASLTAWFGNYGFQTTDLKAQGPVRIFAFNRRY